MLVPQSFALNPSLPSLYSIFLEDIFRTCGFCHHHLYTDHTQSLMLIVRTSRLCAISALITCSYYKLRISPKWTHRMLFGGTCFSPCFLCLTQCTTIYPTVQTKNLRDIFEPFLLNHSLYIDLRYLEFSFKNKNLSTYFSFSSHCHCPFLVLSMSL